MIPDLSKSSKSSRANKPLKRGKACMNCRFLKIKCDGVKPVCGPCRSHPREDDCEYSDGPGRSRTKVLEDQVSRLEARLQELENPDSSTPPVLLHDPYIGHKSHRPSRSPPLHIPESPSVYSPLSPFSPTSTTSSLPSGSSGSSTSPRRRPIPTPISGSEEPTLGSIQAALDSFLPHSQQFGFFLHGPTFRNSALLAFASGHPSRPTPGLLNAVQLMGLHFSQPESQNEHEQALLLRTVQHVATDLISSHPNKVIQTLQAHILLAYYFLRTGCLLEAKCHTGIAVSLALGAGLHKIRSAGLTAPSTIALIQDQPYALPPPQDNLQEAERINGFWTVLTLHKFITVALEPPANVCGALEAPGIQIDTPWPIDMDVYSEGSIPPDLQGFSTLRAFLNHNPIPLDRPDTGHTATALLTKASILFHRAAHLTGQWSPSLSQRDRAAYDVAARSVNALIENFRAGLAPIPTHGSNDPDLRTLLLTYALVDAASIKLHWIFAYAYSNSKDICLTAARNMVTYGDLNLQDFGHINPIMGNLWMTACHVFIDEISRVRQMRATWPDAAALEDDLMECYRNGLKIMSSFSQDSALMRYQVTKVHEAFEAI